MNPTASDGTLNLVSWSTDAVGLAVRVVCVAWGLLVAGYFVGALRAGTDEARETGVGSRHVGPSVLRISRQRALQPHHLVVLVVPAICLIHVALDATFPTRTRIMAGLTVGLGCCLTELGPRDRLRGVGVMATLAVYLIGIWLMRRACRPAAAVKGSCGDSQLP